MRKLRIIVMGMIILACCFIHVQAQNNDVYLDLAYSDNHELSIHKDAEGNNLGVSDFYIEKDIVYVLSNYTNTIYKYHNNELLGTIKPDATYGRIVHFAVDNNLLYIHNNKGEIQIVKEGNTVASLCLYDYVNSEAIEDFLVLDNELIIVVAEPLSEGNIKYVTVNIRYVSPDNVNVQLMDGRIIDGINYESNRGEYQTIKTHIEKMCKENGVILDYIDGISYFGSDKSNGEYYFCCEFVHDNYKFYFLQQIIHIDNKTEHVSTYNIPNMVFTCEEPFKVFDGSLYFLNTTKDRVYLSQAVSTFYDIKSCLIEVGSADDLPQSESKTPLQSNKSIAATLSISRSQAIANALSYYTSFTWSCSNANLIPKANWTCPSYVTGAGSYNSMPYCYGGYSTIADFNYGILTGRNVGNTTLSNAATQLYDNGETVGLDCSGFVCRAWGCGRYYTSNLNTVCNSINISNIAQGDILLKQTSPNSHVMMFYYTLSSTNIVTIEATISYGYDRVNLLNHSKGYLLSNGYSPYKYKYITG